MATANLSAFLRRLTRGMAAETLKDLSDRQLVERFLAGRDEAVFEAVVRRHGPMVYRVCWRVLRQDQDAEDAFQATFLLLAQKLRTVRKHASLASWLHGVARRVALKAKAQAATRRRHEQQVPVSQSLPPDDVTWGELRAVLDAELGQLPEKWRLPLILCYLEGRTQEEAAGQLGWGKNTLRRRLDEARAALGRRLSRRGVVWPAALSAVLLSDCVTSAAPLPGLIDSTIEAAACIAAGQAVTSAVVSAPVAALTEGVTKAMMLTKLKTTVAVVLVVCLVGTTAVGLATSKGGGQPNEEQRLQPAKERLQLEKDVQQLRADVEKLRSEHEKLQKQLQKQAEAEKAAEAKLIIKVYPVTGLTGPQVPDGSEALALMRVINNTIEPKSWIVMGGEGSVEYLPAVGSLIIRQSPDVHEQVRDLLDALRKTKMEQEKEQNKRRA
jgi:RNA polymerase sigma factor (sigma-70 family)